MGLASNPAMRKFLNGFIVRIFSSYMMWHGMLRVKPISISALKSGEPVHGMSRLRTFMMVFCKWQICRASLRSILTDSIPQKQKAYEKNIRKAIIRRISITDCSIWVSKRAWILPIFCWTICLSTSSIKWKDFILIGFLQSRYGSGKDWQGDCQTEWSSGHVKEICHAPHEPRSFSHGCRCIGSKPSMIFREQAPKRQPDFVSAWHVVFAEMV